MPDNTHVSSSDKNPQHRAPETQTGDNTVEQPIPLQANDGKLNLQRLKPSDISRLQRTIGNQAVMRLLADSAAAESSPESEARVDYPSHTFPNGKALYLKRGQTPLAITHNQNPSAVQRKKNDLTALIDGGGDTFKAIKKAVDEYNLMNKSEVTLAALETHLAKIAAISGMVTEYMKNHKDNPTDRTPLVERLRGELHREKVEVLKQKKAVASGENKEEAGPESGVKLRDMGLTYEKALKNHQDDRAALEKVVQEGAAQKLDRRLANTCEWILDGRTKLYAVTEVDEVYFGKKYEGVTRGEAGRNLYFPNPTTNRGFVFGAATTYTKIMSFQEALMASVDFDEDAKFVDDPNVIDVQAAGGGWRNETSIVIVQPRFKERAVLWQQLKHEVQHDADKHADTALGKYKSEYRAYSGQGNVQNGDKFDNLSNAAKDKEPHAAGGFEYQWTPRQWAIFNALYSAPTLYGYLNAAWATDPAFRAAVVAYVDPDTEGVNRDNSIRVDEFYKNLDAVTKVTSLVTDPKVVTLLDSAFNGKYKLDQVDARYILNPESPALMGKINEHLGGAALAEVIKQLNKKAGAGAEAKAAVAPPASAGTPAGQSPASPS